MKKVEKLIVEILNPLLEISEMELVDVQVNRQIISIFIDKEGGIALDDCEKINRELNKLLDEADVDLENYSIEVSSPGLNRALKSEKDFKRFLTADINITTYKPINNQRHFDAKLVGFENGIVKIKKGDGGYMEISLIEISSVRLNQDIKIK